MARPFNLLLKWYPVIVMILLIMVGCRSSEDWADIFLRKGNQYASRGDHVSAIQEYEKARRIDSKNVNVYLRFADVHKQLGNCDAAREYLGIAIRLHLDIPAPYYELIGDCLVQSGHSAEAILRGYNKAIELNPENETYQKKWEKAYNRCEFNPSGYKIFLERERYLEAEARKLSLDLDHSRGESVPVRERTSDE